MIVRRRGFAILPILIFILLSVVVFFSLQNNLLRRKSEEPTTPFVVSDTDLPIISPEATEKGQQGIIEGKITLNYKIPEFPGVDDDINVLISEKGENEANYFGAVNCKDAADNCVWLISETDHSRVYRYRLTLEGEPDIIKVGEQYKVYVSTRHFNNNGNVAGAESNKVSIEVTSSGIKIQDFNLTID